MNNSRIPQKIKTPLTDAVLASLSTGDMVLLSGEIYTARDVAHRRLYEAVLKDEKLPIDLGGAVIFYAGPTPTPPGKIIGSIGPTTSYRMDAFTPTLLENGLKGMIGKGSRSPEVIAAIQKHKAVYFGAIGGIAALTANCVISAEIIAYEDLGTEALRKLTIVDMPVIVINDIKGHDFYADEQKKWCMVT